jgi:hypothetical protein
MKMEKLNMNLFVEKSNNVHSNKYDYSKVSYINNKTKICIICPIHGEFFQTPNSHITGHGCPKCKSCNNKKLIFGVGINDLNDYIFSDYKLSKCYTVWHSMLRRCYSSVYQKHKKSYIGCSVCSEWLFLSNFYKWFNENHVDGFELDKDILFKGNKIYSPQTCSFIPRRINCLLVSCKSKRGIYPIGVKRNGKLYESSCKINGKDVYLGLFKNANDAFLAYKKFKESYIKELATSYYNNGNITKEVYNALLKYEVEIND